MKTLINLLKNNRGFTTIEIILSAFIVSIIFLGLATVYIFSIDAWNRMWVRLAMQQDGTYAIEEMTRDIHMGRRMEIYDVNNMHEGGIKVFYPEPTPPFQEQELYLYYNSEDLSLVRKRRGEDKEIIIPTSGSTLKFGVAELKFRVAPSISEWDTLGTTYDTVNILLKLSNFYGDTLDFLCTTTGRHYYMGGI